MEKGAKKYFDFKHPSPCILIIIIIIIFSLFG